jgi:guanylate kinase
VILEIDYHGAFNVRKALPETVLIFIEPPSAEELERRLRGRATEDEAQIELRLANARQEIACGERYDVRVVNDDVDRAANELVDIIETYEVNGGFTTNVSR